MLCINHQQIPLPNFPGSHCRLETHLNHYLWPYRPSQQDYKPCHLLWHSVRQDATHATLNQIPMRVSSLCMYLCKRSQNLTLILSIESNAHSSKKAQTQMGRFASTCVACSCWAQASSLPSSSFAYTLHREVQHGTAAARKTIKIAINRLDEYAPYALLLIDLDGSTVRTEEMEKSYITAEMIHTQTHHFEGNRPTENGCKLGFYTRLVNRKDADVHSKRVGCRQRFVQPLRMWPSHMYSETVGLVRQG